MIALQYFFNAASLASKSSISLPPDPPPIGALGNSDIGALLGSGKLN